MKFSFTFEVTKLILGRLDTFLKPNKGLIVNDYIFYYNKEYTLSKLVSIKYAVSLIALNLGILPIIQ